jgi:hypothetical protein
MEDFVDWCNHEHHHAGIGLHVPADVHHHRTAQVQRARHRALDRARQAHPERFASAAGLPKILDLPASAWINRPDDDQAEQDSVA